MKKAASSKNRTMKKGIQRHAEIQVNPDVKVLRSVEENEAFYFYETLDKPTGEVARNISDFLDKIKSTKLESLSFHLQRKDFQNWVENTLKDSKLAADIAKISMSGNCKVRTDLCQAVGNRIKELTESSTAILVADNSILLSAK